MASPFYGAPRTLFLNLFGGTFIGNLLSAMYAERLYSCRLLLKPVRLQTRRCFGVISVQSMHYFKVFRGDALSTRVVVRMFVVVTTLELKSLRRAR